MSKITKALWVVLIISFSIALPLWEGHTEEFDWRQFEGSKIVACFPSHVHYDAATKLIPEFTEQTGIKVEIDRLNYLRMHDVQLLELTKPEETSDYDLVSFVCMWKTEYVKGNLLTPLEPFFADPKLAYPDYDFDDLVPAYVDNTGRVGGEKIYMGGPGSTLYAVPFGAETSILAYRKDLFDKFGLEVPQTYDDVRALAKFFAEDVPGIYGLTMRGAPGHQATHAWLLHADPFGAKVFDETWEPAFTSQEALETLEFMQDMIKYGPPGMPGFDFNDMVDAFLEGKTAMFLDTVSIAGAVRNFEKIKLVGNVQYTLHPKHRTRLSETGGFGIGIPENSSNKEAAFLFLQWLTTKEADKKVVLNGGAPFRLSTINDPELQQQFPEFHVLAEQLQYADPDWRPIIPEWGRINELLGFAIHEVLSGEKSPQEAMQSVIEPVKEIMTQAGYYHKK
jgi:multiple sugar transport system substrate-binding protein